MKARVYRVDFIEMKRSIFEQVQSRLAKNECLSCGLPIELDEVPSRGCHNKCARAIYREIQAGHTTDIEEVKAGRFNERLTTGPKPTNPATLAIRGIG